MKVVTVLMPEEYLVALEELVRQNVYASRSSAIRIAVRDLLKSQTFFRK